MDQVTKLVEYVRRLVTSSFFGKLVIGFQNGKITTVTTEQVRKIEEL